jgi:uncharacterized protein with FMN-binding domain
LLASGILLGCGASADSASADEGMADGTYTSTVRAYMRGLNVLVTIQDDRIVAIEVGEHNENEPYLTDSMEALVPRIIETQSTSNIDAVSGATVTCEGIIKAVDKALEQAHEAAAS